MATKSSGAACAAEAKLHAVLATACVVKPRSRVRAPSSATASSSAGAATPPAALAHARLHCACGEKAAAPRLTASLKSAWPGLGGVGVSGVGALGRWG
eukprot:scaffold38718_cov63-Phaeocystis_antarctica.AAC.4